MAFGDMLLETIINKPLHLKEPHFYKTDNSAKEQLEKLKALSETAPAHLKDQIELDIRLLNYGIAGEEQIEYELRNSHQPMIVLHDLRLEFEDLSAQIDYLIITPKITFILECKNLYGDIEVTSDGDFIRTIPVKGNKIREGIYSPITQNKRHLELFRMINSSLKPNAFVRKISDVKFSDWYQSIVVFPNPKTILNLKYAKKEIKDQIIRADQLNQTILSRNNTSKEVVRFEKHMYESADFFLSMHKPNPTDNLQKYQIVGLNTKIEILNQDDQKVELKTSEESQVKTEQQLPLEQTPIYLELKKYRYETSQQEGVKAYFIFNNAELASLIEADPVTIDELKKVNGFGEVKCQKYGSAILEILAKHRT